MVLLLKSDPLHIAILISPISKPIFLHREVGFFMRFFGDSTAGRVVENPLYGRHFNSITANLHSRLNIVGT